MRAVWAPIVASGDAQCAEIICLLRTRAMHPALPWDLAHNRATGGYRGPAHRRCNRAEGARWGNHLRGMRRHTIRRTSRDW